MQDRYAGDVGDFGKFGLLKAITSTNLKLGINWYLTENENHNDDGKHMTNSTKDYCKCDLLLAKALEAIANSDRSVHNLEKLNLIPNATYFNERLIVPTPTNNNRMLWHHNSMEKLKDCDIVFLDPYNGLIVKSVGKASKKSVKYVFKEEIIDYFSRGQSVIFYNHRKRLKEDVYFNEYSEFFNQPYFKEITWYALTFNKGTLRDYFILSQTKHNKKINEAINKLLNSEWNKVFKRSK